MIDELQALKSVNIRSSWTQVAGFVQVNILVNNLKLFYHPLHVHPYSRGKYETYTFDYDFTNITSLF